MDVPVLRRATVTDADAVADVWLRSYAVALPTVRRAHSDDEVRGWIRNVVVPRYETWLAVAEVGVVGMMALRNDWMDQLYLEPQWRGRSIGDRLVELAKRRRPAGLQLWTFQVNSPARRFYERHGFIAVEHTDGTGNEEREPDIRYRWQPPDTGGAVPEPEAARPGCR